MFYQTSTRTFMLITFTLICIYVAFTADYFGLEILTEILILAMIAMALDMVAGFGGMVSLCHGALAGVGAYAYAVCTAKLGWNVPLSIVLTCCFTGVIAWIIGAVCSRTHGIYFIMATLAFGQMAYSFVFESAYLGGDNGLSGIPRLDLSAINIDLFDSRNFALVCLFALFCCYLFAWRILSSGLGRSLVGLMYSEQRSLAIGQNVSRIKAHVFGLSGLILGLAGSLGAQHIMFISPNLLMWTYSGEVLVVTILGGLGTLFGPIVGAAAFILLKHQVSEYTNYWHLAVGIILIAVVMGGAKGLYGSLEAYIEQRLRSRSSTSTNVISEEE
ncbi:MAG: branched-chain amino acid ABC transporter permease [Gammaproteobacteria bacterium]|nr:branched-chain amino acid ABC transporter permease [Gammaproteobacteria bacterium]MDP6165627.1 branched-chain amino acid ABC transporter permease [Gammaproteobacteria bacterium]